MAASERSDRLFECDREGADSSGNGMGLYLVETRGSVKAEENVLPGTRTIVTLPIVE